MFGVKKMMVKASVLAATGVVAAILSAPTALASTEARSAESGDFGVLTERACTSYLANLGYVIGPRVEAGCHAGATGNISACPQILYDTGVFYAHAVVACTRAVAG